MIMLSSKDGSVTGQLSARTAAQLLWRPKNSQADARGRINSSSHAAGMQKPYWRAVLAGTTAAVVTRDM